MGLSVNGFFIFVNYILPLIFLRNVCSARQEIVEYSYPDMCQNDEYFDTELLSCIRCDLTKNLKPSHNRLSCVCTENSKLVGFERGSVVCVSCDPKEIPTSDGSDCIACKDNDVNGTCTCSPGEIKLERKPSGALLDTIECLPCLEGFSPSSDGTRCLPCGRTNCSCPVSSHVQIQNYCVPKSSLTDWPDVRNTYLIKYESRSIDSYYFRMELQLAVYLCRIGNGTACEHLSNMCALTLFVEGTVCKLFLKSRYSPSWLFYGEGEAPTILRRKKISQRYSLKENANSGVFNFTTAIFSLKGEFQSLGKPNLLCDLLNDVRFGVNLDRQCRVSAEKLLNERMTFLKLFLVYNETGKLFLYALPILVKNINKDEADSSRWRLVRKFFLIDNTSGFEAYPNPTNVSFEREGELSVLRYAKSIHLSVKVQNKEDGGKIYPPLLIVEYGELTREEIRKNVEVFIEYKVTYVLADNDACSDIEISTGVLSTIAIAFSTISTWSYVRRNGNSVFSPTTFFWFLIYSSGALGNVFVLVSFGASVYVFIFYKGQTVLHVLLPSDECESRIRVLTITAFCLKSVEIAALFYRIRSTRVFFLDWEQSRTVRSQSKCDSPHTSLRKLYSNRFLAKERNHSQTLSGAFTAGRNETWSKPSESESPSRDSRFPTPNRHDKDIISEQSNGSTPVGGRGDDDASQKLPVSAWRTYFIANSWYRIRMKRKISVFVRAVVVLFLLEVVGLKFWALAIPELSVESQENLVGVNWNLTLRYAVGTLVYLSVYCVQWLISVAFYERYITSIMQEFVDLCSIANISVFIMPLNYYGFYIHGRSVHGFADTDFATLLEESRKEENDLCAQRGLVPGTTEQAFIISVTPTFRAFYKKLANPSMTGDDGHPRKDILDTSDRDKNLLTYLKMKRFLTDFLDHCYPDLDYVVKERQFLEKLCDIELTNTTERSTFYTDNNCSFSQVIFYGNEWALATFELTLFIFIEVLWRNYVLAVIITVLASQLLVVLCHLNEKRNIAANGVIDEKFLLY